MYRCLKDNPIKCEKSLSPLEVITTCLMIMKITSNSIQTCYRTISHLKSKVKKFLPRRYVTLPSSPLHGSPLYQTLLPHCTVPLSNSRLLSLSLHQIAPVEGHQGHPERWIHGHHEASVLTLLAFSEALTQMSSFWGQPCSNWPLECPRAESSSLLPPSSFLSALFRGWQFLKLYLQPQPLSSGTQLVYLTTYSTVLLKTFNRLLQSRLKPKLLGTAGWLG